ncbi:MAG: HEAT repeat domain-containing protein [Polyangiales bacterium]
MTLIDRLTEAGWSERRALIAELASASAVPALVEALRTRRDDETRIAAVVDALAGSSGDVESALAPLAEDADPAIVADVAQILGRRRSGLAILVALTRHADDNVAVGAIEALGKLGGQSAVEALIACVESNSFFRVFPAIDVLGRTGDPRAIEPLSKLLDNPRYLLEAARALGRSADRAAAAPLLRLLSTPSESSLRVACVALSELAERHEELYGSQVIFEPLRELRSERLVRRLAQALGNADKGEKLALCRVLGALQSGLAVQALMNQLDGEPELTRAATAALRQIGRDSDRAIGDALAQASSARRAALLPGLLHSEHGAAVIACLHDPEPNVRALAAEALARLGVRAATPQLFELLEDPLPRVVHAATAAISALGDEQTEGLALRAAGSAVPEVRRAGLRILGYFGYPAAFEAFAAALREPDQRLRDAAAAGLAMLDEPRARPLLREVAREPDAKLRAAAVRALGQAELDDDTTALLQRALADQDAWVRYYACQALGRLRVDAALPALSALLQDPAGQVRVAAVEALSHLPGATDTLRTCAASADPDMRRAALLGLGLRADVDSLPIFLQAARGDDAATRLVALSALASLHTAEGLSALAQAARDEDEAVQSAAIGYLQAAPGGTLHLIELAREGARVANALSTPHPERVAALLVGLADADDTLATLLTSCLSRLGGNAGRDGLLAALTLDNRAARMAAAHALAALGTREASAALALCAANDPDPELRRVCSLHLSG